MKINKKISFSLLKALNIGVEYLEKYINEEISQDDAALLFGSAVHHYFLQRDSFDSIYTIVTEDDGKTSSTQQKMFVDYMTNVTYSEANIVSAYKQSYKVKDSETEESVLKKAKVLYLQLKPCIDFVLSNSDKLKLSSKDLSIIETYEQSIKYHKGISELLRTDKNREEFSEFTIEFIYRNEECKAILDKLVIDHVNKSIYILELKTHAVKSLFSNIQKSFLSSIDEFDYDKQIAFYIKAVEAFINSDRKDLLGYEIKPFWIVFQKNFFKVVKLYSISNDALKLAENGLNLWIDKFIEYRKYNFIHSDEYINNRFGEELLL